jgi:histidinol-phosphate aminotransferase
MAATASIQDAQFLAYSKKSNDVAKMIYTSVLKELDLFYLPSETNFVFHRLNRDLEPFKQHMLDEHIIVGRPFPPAEGWCRVSMGTPDEMIYVAEKMREFRKKGWI